VTTLALILQINLNPQARTGNKNQSMFLLVLFSFEINFAYWASSTVSDFVLPVQSYMLET